MTMPQPNEPVEQNDPVTAPEGDGNEQTVFDKEYVSKLRAEAAEARTALKEVSTRGDALAELLLTRSIEAAAGSLLQDVTDLPRDGDYYGEDGSPDLEKITAAAVTLTEAKPYLAKVTGNIHQTPQQRDEPVPSFGDLARLAMR